MATKSDSAARPPDRDGRRWYDRLVERRNQVVKAMALIKRERDGALLVSQDVNPSGALFHRPLGGHVEFGEYALDTVHRELREEIGQALANVRLAGVLENIFEWNGATQHEMPAGEPASRGGCLPAGLAAAQSGRHRFWCRAQPAAHGLCEGTRTGVHL
jgi:8-oxo-dGTP pyrophosphatase MutT (NUDIX family)